LGHMLFNRAVRQTEYLRNLRVRELIDLAQHEDAPAERRQAVDGGAERLESAPQIHLLIGLRLLRGDVQRLEIRYVIGGADDFLPRPIDRQIARDAKEQRPR